MWRGISPSWQMRHSGADALHHQSQAMSNALNLRTLLASVLVATSVFTVIGCGSGQSSESASEAAVQDPGTVDPGKAADPTVNSEGQ